VCILCSSLFYQINSKRRWGVDFDKIRYQVIRRIIKERTRMEMKMEMKKAEIGMPHSLLFCAPNIYFLHQNMFLLSLQRQKLMMIQKKKDHNTEVEKQMMKIIASEKV
jgi:hypothetical protein